MCECCEHVSRGSAFCARTAVVEFGNTMRAALAGRLARAARARSDVIGVWLEAAATPVRLAALEPVALRMERCFHIKMRTAAKELMLLSGRGRLRCTSAKAMNNQSSALSASEAASASTSTSTSAQPQSARPSEGPAASEAAHPAHESVEAAGAAKQAEEAERENTRRAMLENPMNDPHLYARFAIKYAGALVLFFGAFHLVRQYEESVRDAKANPQPPPPSISPFAPNPYRASEPAAAPAPAPAASIRHDPVGDIAQKVHVGELAPPVPPEPFQVFSEIKEDDESDAGARLSERDELELEYTVLEARLARLRRQQQQRDAKSASRSARAAVDAEKKQIKQRLRDLESTTLAGTELERSELYLDEYDLEPLISCPLRIFVLVFRNRRPSFCSSSVLHVWCGEPSRSVLRCCSLASHPTTWRPQQDDSANDDLISRLCVSSFIRSPVKVRFACVYFDHRPA
ncbi:hypothetical protein FVE85_9808 [Porphyridium purpureum]|uniref:Uncharacterized protein n=1 Tax=Porphyridium purpureum TaxID=35688 RepID=A0A5J4YHI0_PORPP|nr:hypothetical protein FVE85_9808 [Porphyridium purpureum]|eukprot:POR9805..scf289_17